MLVLVIIVKNGYINPMPHFLMIQILVYSCYWINQENGQALHQQNQMIASF